MNKIVIRSVIIVSCNRAYCFFIIVQEQIAFWERTTVHLLSEPEEEITRIEFSEGEQKLIS